MNLNDLIELNDLNLDLNVNDVIVTKSRWCFCMSEEKNRDFFFSFQFIQNELLVLYYKKR